MQSDNSIICDSNDVSQRLEYTPLTNYRTFNDPKFIYVSNTQEIQRQPAEKALDSTNKMLAEILRDMGAQKQQIHRLTKEVITLRNELRQFKLTFSEDTKTNLVPPLSLKTRNQLQEMHQQIQNNEDIVVQLKYIISKVGGDCSKSFIRNAIKKIISDDLAAKLSWRGTNNKSSIQEFNITKIIINACHSKYSQAEDAIINKVFQQHFVHAGDRLRKAERTKKVD